MAALKNLLLCLAFLSSGASIPAATNTPNSIPWNQIGAKAGADYKGDGLTVTPTDSGARLHCVFQRLDGEASPEGLWLTSTVSSNTTDRFRVTAIEVGRTATRTTLEAAATAKESGPRPHGGRGIKGEGESPEVIESHNSLEVDPESTISLPATGTVSLSGQTVRFTRPGLTEEYSVSMDGIRQDFIVEQAPPDARNDSSPSPPLGVWVGVRGMKLRLQQQVQSGIILQLSITGARVEPAPGGATLILENSHRRIAYNRLRVTDATGKQLPARIEIQPPHNETKSLFDSTDFLKQLGTFSPIGGEGQDEGVSGSLSIIINDTDALYPLRIDPTFSDANWISVGGVPGVNGVVFATVADGSGNLYIGGAFTVAGGTIANNVAEWNGNSWSALGPGLGGGVNALALSGTNLYAGGSFTNAGGTVANCIAEWNGSVWLPLGSGMNNTVDALAVSGDTLYAGGGFTNAGGTAAYDIAQWNGTNWSPVGLGMNAAVASLAVSGGTLYAGGYFTTAGGSNVNYVAQWNGTNWSALGSGLSGEVSALAVSGATLYVGGDFSTAGGVAASSVAQWNGSSWSALGTGINGSVYAFAVSGSTLYAGGMFTNAGSIAVRDIAQWNGTGWSALGSGLTEEVFALAISGGTLYAGGNFTTILIPDTNVVRGIAQWNGSTWTPPNSTSAFGNEVVALAASGTNLYAGGLFGDAGANPANHVAQWNGSAWSALGSGISGGDQDGPAVLALAASGSTLYAGGDFTKAGGNAANYIAKWNGSSWSSLSSGMNSYVWALLTSGSTLYAGGGFSTAGGSAATYVAQWNGNSWSPLGSIIGPAGVSVYALAMSGTTLYAGGYFTNASGNPANSIAQWNGSSWSPLGSGINGTVYALAVSNGILYAGGSFTSAGGNAANNIAQWNGSNWSPLGLGVSNNVRALVVSGGSLYAGGWFTNAGSIPANYIAEWNGSTWSPLGSGLNGFVFAIVPSGNALYVGGSFTTAGTNGAGSVAEAMLPVPVSVSILTTNGLFGFDIAGPPGSNVLIQTSTDLQNWFPLQTNQLNPNGLLYFSDSQSPPSSQRFYQAVLP